MVAFPNLFLSIWLLAASNPQPRRSGKNQARKKKSPRSPPNAASNAGRGRYGRSGKKRPKGGSSEGSLSKDDVISVKSIQDLLRIDNNGPRPAFFTCRHTYEDVLIQELQERFPNFVENTEQISSLAPGLIQCLPSPTVSSVFEKNGGIDSSTSTLLDPVYALQLLPDCVVVSAESIKGLSDAIQTALLGSDDDTNNLKDPRCLDLQNALRNAPRSSLAIHGLVPGMFKGQKNPLMAPRVTKVVDEISKQLKRGYPAARKERADSLDEAPSSERWLLQVLLLTPTVAAASLTRCNSPTIQARRKEELSYEYWPNWYFPAGMAKVDIVETMPSSAYRKLLEAMACLGLRPAPHDMTAVDLGASPGGWTSVLRREWNCPVLAVDRSPLDPILSRDPDITFVQGDAFTFVPEVVADDIWMVSDVIAYPERVTEDLLERWCGGQWASHMIVTMKFQGESPDFTQLYHAMDIAASYGYVCRAKHFFNNKNEVTLMIQKIPNGDQTQVERGNFGTPMYPSILPTRDA